MFSRKFLIYLGVIVGSGLGSLVPKLWGAGLLSSWGILFSSVGAFVGFYVGYKLGEMIEG